MISAVLVYVGGLTFGGCMCSFVLHFRFYTPRVFNVPPSICIIYFFLSSTYLCVYKIQFYIKIHIRSNAEVTDESIGSIFLFYIRV